MGTGIPAHVLAHDNSKYLTKLFTDDSVISCNVIISVRDSISTNVTNIVPSNVMSSVSINSVNKKRYKMDYILHMLLLVTILLFIITIICYHYTKT